MSGFESASTLRHGRARIQDLAEAVLAGGEEDELLDLLLGTARSDLDAATAVLVLPAGEDTWVYEMAVGAAAPDLLGESIDPTSPIGKALHDDDAEALEVITMLQAGENSATSHHCLISLVDAGEHGHGFLAALHPHENTESTEATAHPAHAKDPRECTPFTDVDRERLDALAGLIALTLRLPTLGTDPQLEDERSRIARDLHDLAIQELFAVGMELETLRDALASPENRLSDARIRDSVSTSVTGVENAVAQIREIVQSLRRERAEATLSERLRHEVALATAGLGFVPALRVPQHPSDMDAEVPDEIAEDVVAVVRECLANAARHAHATAVACAVSLFSEGVDRVVQVNVSDNGRGIDPSVTRRSGLANMSSRARRHNGWVDAFNLEPGTMISWRVTLPPQ